MCRRKYAKYYSFSKCITWQRASGVQLILFLLFHQLEKILLFKGVKKISWKKSYCAREFIIIVLNINISVNINIAIYYVSTTCGTKAKHLKHIISNSLFPKGGKWGSESLCDWLEYDRRFGNPTIRKLQQEEVNRSWPTTKSRPKF